MAELIYPGDLVEVKGEFRDLETGDFVDPTTVVLKVRSAVAKTTATYTYLEPESPIARNTEGEYVVNVTPTVSGTWYYQWIGTGACQAVSEGKFYVERVRITS